MTHFDWQSADGSGDSQWQPGQLGGPLNAGPQTNYFRDPLGVMNAASGPLVLAPIDGDFQLSCRVDCRLVTTFDAIGMFVYRADDQWAKFAYERSPQQTDTIVTVVTNGFSDDSNGPESVQPYMRISRVGNAYAFHDSSDGSVWEMRRLFTIGEVADHRVGFFIQSPLGEGLSGSIGDVSFKNERLADFRDGS